MDYKEIGFKCNFAFMDEKTGVVLKRRVDRNFTKWGLPLIDLLNGMKIPGFDNYKISVVHATEHRCGLKVSGDNLSFNITGADPLKDNLKLRTVSAKDPNSKEAVFTASLVRGKMHIFIFFSPFKVNALSKEINKLLRSHPINLERAKQNLPVANILLLRGCGSRLSKIVQKAQSYYDT